MKKTAFPLIVLLIVFELFVFDCPAQTLLVAPGVRLPADSFTRADLIGSLQGWLQAMGGPDSLNRYVALEDMPATDALMADMRRLKGDCYLGNLTPLDSLHWQVQLNYMDARKDTPVLRACCTVLMRREGDRFYVSSPLARNTVGWKSRTIGCCTFHYRTEMNAKKAREFVRQIASYDRRLEARGANIDFYCCENTLEAMKLLGEDYWLSYSGAAFLEFGGGFGNRTVVVSGRKFSDGFNGWDPHDWWHDRLHRVVSTRVINRPVDEGMAYLYGGSWDIYQWADILKMIQDYRAAHPDADWLALYKEGVNLVPPPKIIKISYAINALIVRKLEKERGFAASLPLLCCGPKEAGDANYFAALDKVCGVKEGEFNQYVTGLLDARQDCRRLDAR
jgi:hypothetical protein